MCHQIQRERGETLKFIISYIINLIHLIIHPMPSNTALIPVVVTTPTQHWQRYYRYPAQRQCEAMGMRRGVDVHIAEPS